jgi:hypothetical protein
MEEHFGLFYPEQKWRNSPSFPYDKINLVFSYRIDNPKYSLETYENIITLLFMKILSVERVSGGSFVYLRNKNCILECGIDEYMHRDYYVSVVKNMNVERVSDGVYSI